VTYALAGFVTSHRTGVPSIVFAWERRIPFLAWSIVPYWSIDVFYGLSVFVCKTRTELDLLVRRLLTAQIIAVTCFLLFPLKFAFSRPVTHGIPSVLFRALAAVDRPVNQAPSLHIALLVILWRLYGKHVRGVARTLLHLWFALIGISVLTTYQHHVFDVPTGALLGLFSVWLWPDAESQSLGGTLGAGLRVAHVWTPDAHSRSQTHTSGARAPTRGNTP
jgi:membrane-associated phospholipid phosphatase